jgi:hypothetical protein
MDTEFPLWRPFHTSANLPDVNAISPSFEMFSESMQERGEAVCKPRILLRMRTLFLRRSRDMFGTSKACTGAVKKVGCSDSHLQAYLIEDFDEGYNIIAL